jgi:uncharacterized Zn finger protein
MTQAVHQHDRRNKRLTLPPCSQCETAEKIKVVVRTDYVLYLRCHGCGNFWSVRKPAGRPMGE